jgi:uncharacterized protein YgiM (DUF1202 family)
MKRILTLITLTAMLWTGLAVAEEVVFVQAVKTGLKKTPQMDSPTLVELKRGDELKILKKQEPWYEVSFKKKKGWVSRLFVNTHRPIGQADLNKDVKENVEKASRRRSSSYAVSASTRALSAGTRVREGREQYQADYEALAEIEKQSLPASEIESFRKSAKLSQ